MTDEISLIWAIQDNPDDDILRLAYADWLDEFAPERTQLAKHIRAAIRAAQKPGPPPDSETECTLASIAAYNREFAEWRAAILVEDDTFPDAKRICSYSLGWGICACTASFNRDKWRGGLPYRCPSKMRDWLNVGPQLVRVIPVTQIEFADRRPLYPGRRVPSGWYNAAAPWALMQPPDASQLDWTAAGLPEGIFRNLSGIPPYQNWTITSSVADVSRAAILWARSVEPKYPARPEYSNLEPTYAAPQPAA